MVVLLGKGQVAEARWTSVISVIIPVLCEVENISTLRQSTHMFRSLGIEVIIVDGGSDDGTQELVRAFADNFISAPLGRAKQLNAGAASAKGEVLLFLHADTNISNEAFVQARDRIGSSEWGRFDVRIDNSKWFYRIVEYMINLRSRITGIATGDQAIFVRKSLFYDIGGFADIPLMEDVEISRRLKQRARPVCLKQKVVTSARYWEKHGLFTSVLRMWSIRFAYWVGCSPERLYKRYYR
ncbi:MAG: TIGR04283 family arsenosugar biosynthesis glycosyltransferase [Arenicellaceae bacterium]|nr:TIGR04283 family arsenosugar biosynthesis glycosyltransferase [Arenicellaceae bacterium]